MAVLTYHSLEDRIVKTAFRAWAARCLCPPSRPICDCGWTPKVRLLSSRLRRPSAQEIERNPRARSAGLRVVERLEP
jgi:16S rRNA (cytosine1402-N4)-methyltransferase